MKKIFKKVLVYLNFNISSIFNSTNLVIPVRGGRYTESSDYRKMDAYAINQN